MAPVLGPEANKKAFLEAAGKAFPRMANFSFDYGDVHWTVLDANATVDWTDPRAARVGRARPRRRQGRDLAVRQLPSARLQLLEAPLRRAIHADPRPRLRGRQGRPRLQRPRPQLPAELSAPVRPGRENGAAPTVGKDGKLPKVRHVDGKWTLDKTFNGQTDTTPEGVIYVVTGAGGQHLYNPEQQDDPASWQEFTYKHVSKVFSLTVVDVDGSTLTVRQMTPDGEEVDHFAVTK